MSEGEESDRRKQSDCGQLICGLPFLIFYTIALASAEDDEKDAKAYKLFLASVIIKWISCVFQTAIFFFGKSEPDPRNPLVGLSSLVLLGWAIVDIWIFEIGWLTPCDELDLSDGLLCKGIEVLSWIIMIGLCVAALAIGLACLGCIFSSMCLKRGDDTGNEDLRSQSAMETAIKAAPSLVRAMSGIQLGSRNPKPAVPDVAVDSSEQYPTSQPMPFVRNSEEPSGKKAFEADRAADEVENYA